MPIGLRSKVGRAKYIQWWDPSIRGQFLAFFSFAAALGLDGIL